MSRPAPSNLLLAAEVAEHCYNKHLPVEALPDDLKWDIDKLAGYFYDRGDFPTYFIQNLVPWGELASRPNKAHAAVADFLLTRTAAASLTANFDRLVEQWCERRRTQLQGALTGTEAVQFSKESSPLLKFHGCMWRGPEYTLWTHGQLEDPQIQQRIQSCREWMNQNLPGKDLLVVGFWTDWGYLNEVLSDLLHTQTPVSVTVVDPQETAALEAKATGFWENLSQMPQFEHVQMSSDEALSELQSTFSQYWIRRHYISGKELFEDQSGGTSPADEVLDCPALSCEDLYDLRRDAEGVSYTRAARLATPGDGATRVGFVRIKLLDAGAEYDGPFLTLNGRTIRVVCALNKSISKSRSQYNEPPTGLAPDMVICAGATSHGTVENIVRGSGSKSILGETFGGETAWMTETEAFEELGI